MTLNQRIELAEAELNRILNKIGLSREVTNSDVADEAPKPPTAWNNWDNGFKLNYTAPPRNAKRLSDPSAD